MDNKPEDKKPEPPKGPPRPPVGGKKPEGLPKGPVPPRGQNPMPRIPMPGQKPNSPLKPTAPSGVPPSMPSPMRSGNAVPAPVPNNSAPQMPPRAPGMPGVPPAASAPKPPNNFELSVYDAEKSKSGLEEKVSELEKKLMEEREKVLIASLRNKEEEAVSSKVESSIKDIQDKLRREKKEQEMEESRRKAEARVVDMERRIAEEREAWVATLKTQLNQRDSVTQEMESHFSTRLKDLEYRWAQEKTALEEALRDREADLGRLKQEVALKSEQEKAFWEDRLRSVVTERDKMDRELDRLKDKYQQEKDQLIFERQNLREQISRLETTNKMILEQSEFEKGRLKRDAEAASEMARKQMALDVEHREKEIGILNNQVQITSREAMEKGAQLESLKGQLTNLQNQLNTYQHKILDNNHFSEEIKEQIIKQKQLIEKLQAEHDQAILAEKHTGNLLKDIQDQKSKIETSLLGVQQDLIAVEKEKTNQRKDYENQIETLVQDLQKTRTESMKELSRAQFEADTRLRTLQARLEWYDSNANREYELAREKVRIEVGNLEKKLHEATVKAEQSTAYETEKDALLQDRDALKKELDQIRAQWKQAQWEMESQSHLLQEELKIGQNKIKGLEDAQLTMEQELKQRVVSTEYDRSLLEQRNAEIDRLKDNQAMLEKNGEEYKEQIKTHQQQIQQQRKMMQGHGLGDLEETREKLTERTKELEEARTAIRRLKEGSADVERAEDLFKEKERVLKQLIEDKGQSAAEFKSRVQGLERDVKELMAEIDNQKGMNKKMLERMTAEKEDELQQKLFEEKHSLARTHQEELKQISQNTEAEVKRLQEELEKMKQAYEQEAFARSQAESSQSGADPQLVETQIRERVELELANRLQDQEGHIEEKIKKVKEEAKKEADKIRWETESLREDLKKARDARVKIEREAQELLQAAEDHYKNELDKKLAELQQGTNKGIFTSIGKFLDTPIIDTKKKKGDL